jgi:hypothetical protein
LDGPKGSDLKTKRSNLSNRATPDQRHTPTAREEAYAALDEIWEKMKDEDPEEVEKLVDEAVREVREGARKP